MEQQLTDVVVVARDLPPGGSSALVAAMHARSEWERIPLLGLADSAAELETSAIRAAGFMDCQVKFDVNAILASVTRLVSAQSGSPDNEPIAVGEEK
jgi:hypothetical protein